MRDGDPGTPQRLHGGREALDLRIGPGHVGRRLEVRPRPAEHDARRRGDEPAGDDGLGGRQPVAPQAGLDGQVQVLDGLTAGDEVVVYSDRKLAAGSRIEIADAIAGRKP